MKTQKTVVNGMLLLRLMVVSLLVSSLATAQTSTINLTSQQQFIRGFGGMNFPRWIGDLTTAQADLAFGNGAGQIGFSILRVDVPPDQAQWSANVPTAVRAQSHGAIVFATPWSPPASMKTNNNLIGGQLSTSSYGAYANHLSSYSNFMSSNGAPLYAISIQNEPDITVDYESCDWNSTQFNNFLIQQGSTIPTRVIVAESFQFLRPLTDAILNNSSASAQVDIIGGHIYGGGLFSYPLAQNQGKEVWMTEHLVNNTDWAGALATGKEIHDCMVANFNAYVWWYIRRSYGPIDESGNVTKRGYVMSQFTKFVRPGYTRVAATASPTTNVDVTAYKNGSSVIIVALNRNSSTRNITFTLQNGSVTSFTKYTTSSSKNVSNDGSTNLSGSSFTATLDASSISTFVSSGTGSVGTTSIWLEAECGTVGSLWNTNSSGTASNGSYVTIQSGNNSTGSAPSSSTGHVSFPFSVSESGNYVLWCRVIAPTGNDDSFWIRMDGGSWINWNNIAPGSTSWTWDDVQSFNLSSGNHTLTVTYREDGAQLDKVYITNTGNTPSGTGSAATNCSANQPPNANAGNDQTVTDSDGNGSQSVTLNGSGSNDPDGTITSYVWTEGANQIATGATPAVTFSVGVHNVTLTVTDNGGAQDTDNVTITVNAPASGSVWLEAECGTRGSLWNVVSSGTASNSQYVTIQAGNNSTGSAPTNTNGHITYNFSVSSTASYVLWCRVIAPNANDDSFWIRMDGGSWINWNNIAPGSTSWTWDDVQSFSLSSGSHTLTVAYREDGAQLDKIYITNSGTTPSGTGSTATNCGAGKEFSDLSLDEAMPTGFSLSDNYPNPFNPTTVITFQLPVDSEVSLEIYNINGELVMQLASGKFASGRHEITFDAKGLASGVYFYRLRAGSFAQTKRMLLVK
ncbi:MAG: T9SS type A sorting domain-containing protein [Anaerolineae bacterium]|nr:T9SS type A sorting domain-containing protein [Anaerolineae bacterium]